MQDPIIKPLMPNIARPDGRDEDDVIRHLGAVAQEDRPRNVVDQPDHEIPWPIRTIACHVAPVTRTNRQNCVAAAQLTSRADPASAFGAFMQRIDQSGAGDSYA